LHACSPSRRPSWRPSSFQVEELQPFGVQVAQDIRDEQVEELDEEGRQQLLE
jgi:hypothetical protein